LNLKTNLQSRLHNIYKEREIKNHHLQYVFLEITKRCNLNCLHCGSDCKKEVLSAELTTDSWIKIITYLKNRFSKSIAFVITGGEPLMNSDVYKIGSFINENGMRWGMVTNGIMLNLNHLDNLIKSGISSITLSLDGLADSHNWLRNNESAFTRTIQALKIIAQSDIEFRDVVTCVSPKNIHELENIAQLLIEHGIPNWRLFRIFPSGRALSNPELKLSFDKTKQLLQWIKVNRPVYLKKGLNMNLSCEGWIPFEQDKKLRDFPFFCRSGINIASILSDGTITGCSNNSEGFHVGNILNDNFGYLWENHFELFRTKKWLANTVCADCKHIKSCKGSSIHLWDLGDSKPKFCYEVDMDNIQNAK
jgi:radical SAM protein with 4Fe4S-binding SPASM domain